MGNALQDLAICRTGVWMFKQEVSETDIRRMFRARSAFPLGVVLASLIAVPAVADPTISSYPVTPAGTDPGSIVSGPNGDLWFTERKADALGYSTPAGVVGQRPGLSSPGYDLASDLNGDLWITEPDAGAIARLTPTGVLSNFPVESSSGKASAAAPIEITAGPDGNMWFTADGPNKPAIGKITSAGAVTLYTNGLNPKGYPLAIASGPDGNLWFTEWDKNVIGKITTTGTITEYALPPGAIQPDAITAGPDGNLWFTTFGGAGAIGRITPAGAVTLFTTGLIAGSQPTSITTGPDHNLWFTEAGGPAAPGAPAPAPAPDSDALAPAAPAPPAPAPAAPAAIGIVTPAGTITEYSSGVPAGSMPTDITTGPDGNLWFTESGDPGSLGRILMPATATAPAPAPTKPAPTAAAPSGPQPAVSLPAIGRTAVAAVLSGQVEVAGASGRFAPLSAQADIKVGDIINTKAGVVGITTRLRTARHRSLYQTAKIWDGVFRLEQSRRRSLTTFRLVGVPGCKSPRRASHRLGRARPSAKQTKPSKPILWARDSGGQYSTRGQNSVATVRGTEWETIESCAGTTTYVKRGVVAVRNIHTGRTVLVHAGHRYLARS
jgi:streptogramin lyase